jgi:hypothetical protein
MGKLINMGRAKLRRMGIFDGETEEDAERMRKYIEWMRLTRHGKRDPDPRAMPPRPQVPPGSKADLKVVWRRRS